MVELAEIPQTISAAADSAQAMSRARLRMAGVCIVGVALGAAILPYSAVGAALGPMMLEFGWGANQISLAYGLLLWAGGLSVWPMGVLIDRYGARPVVAASAGGIAVVSLLLPMVREFWQFCALAALWGALGSSGIGYTRIVTCLFGPRRGLAIGILSAVGSALSVLMPLAMSRLVLEGGWRGAFTGIGVVMLGLAPIIYLSLAFGRRGQASSLRWPGQAPRAQGMGFSAALRDRSFWIIVAASLSTAAMGGGVMVSFGSAMAAQGFEQAAVMRAAPISLMAALAGAIFTGALLDRSRSPRTAGAAFLVTGLAYLLWTLASVRFGGEPMLIVGLAAGAFAFTAQVTLVLYVFSRYFGLKAFGAFCGLQAFIQAVIPTLAGPVIGHGLGLFGDYHLAFGAGIGVQVLAALLYLRLPGYRYAAIAEADGSEPARLSIPIARVRSQ